MDTKETRLRSALSPKCSDHPPGKPAANGHRSNEDRVLSQVENIGQEGTSPRRKTSGESLTPVNNVPRLKLSSPSGEEIGLKIYKKQAQDIPAFVPHANSQESKGLFEDGNALWSPIPRCLTPRIGGYSPNGVNPYGFGFTFDDVFDDDFESHTGLHSPGTYSKSKIVTDVRLKQLGEVGIAIAKACQSADEAHWSIVSMEKDLDKLQRMKASEEAKLPQAITCFPKSFEKSLRAGVRDLDLKIARITEELAKRREDHDYAAAEVERATLRYQDANQRYIRMCVHDAVANHMPALKAEFNRCLSKLSEAMEVIRGEVLSIKPSVEQRMRAMEIKIQSLQLASALGDEMDDILTDL